MGRGVRTGCWVLAAGLACLLHGSPIEESAAFVESFRARQPLVDRLLLDHRAFEDSNGFLAANQYAREPLATAERAALDAENSGRAELYRWMAFQVRDEPKPTPEQIGQQRVERYHSRLKAGILRQDPASGQIFDDWPPVPKPAETLLRAIFSDLDSKEAPLFRDARAKLNP